MSAAPDLREVIAACLLCSTATAGERLCSWCRALIRGEEIEARHEEWWSE